MEDNGTLAKEKYLNKIPALKVDTIVISEDDRIERFADTRKSNSH